MPSADILRPGDAVRIREERWRVTRWTPFSGAALIEVAGAGVTNRGVTTRFLLPFEPVERLATIDRPRTVRPTVWRAAARRALATATPQVHALRGAARANIAIASFQLEPALALLAGRGCRVLIADAVGLGKTVQAGLAIAELLAREPDARVLVVCPAGLREQWQAELADRFGLAAPILDAAGAARLAAAHGAGHNPWAVERLVITSIDYVKRPEVMRAFEPLLWDLLVFDEAHALAGTSDRANAANALAERARRVILLTATPHSGDEDAFRRLCDIGRFATDPPLVVFRRGREAAGIPGRRRQITLRVAPTAAETAMHRALAAYARRVQPDARLAMSVLLRRACSSAWSFARSVERRLEWLSAGGVAPAQMPLPFGDLATDDEEPSTVLAARGLADAAEEQRLLRRLLDLGQRAGARESKIAALARLLRRAGQPALVFTEYRDTLVHLAGRLPQAAACLHGGMTATQRRSVLRAFADGSVDLLLATDAASEGLNLHQRCRLVINLELPWTPLRLEQRVGRLDRIGQPRIVHAVSLVGRGTAEEGLAARHAGRRERASASLQLAATVDVRAEAEAEAARLATVRRLLSPRQQDEPERYAGRASRPVLCTVRRRAGGARGSFRVWRAVVTGSDGQLLWEPLIPIHIEPGARVDEDAIARAAGAAERQLLAALADEMRETLAALAAREQSIEGALRHRQARLAATLLQPGLFDRRSERAAAAQASLLRGALACCEARLRGIAAVRELRVDERRLLFAVTFS